MVAISDVDTSSILGIPDRAWSVLIPKVRPTNKVGVVW